MQFAQFTHVYSILKFKSGVRSNLWFFGWQIIVQFGKLWEKVWKNLVLIVNCIFPTKKPTLSSTWFTKHNLSTLLFHAHIILQDVAYEFLFTDRRVTGLFIHQPEGDAVTLDPLNDRLCLVTDNLSRVSTQSIRSKTI